MPSDTHSWIDKYLKRINFHDPAPVGLRTLIKLHEHHVFTVPFENIDVRFKRKFSLNKGDVYSKVVENNRGGFCYELNYIFRELLNELGFGTKIISCKVINEAIPGPEFDHMAIIVSCNSKEYLADVGFGDLFVQPLALKTAETQFDGRNFFKIEEDKTTADHVLSMSDDGSVFKKVYTFNVVARMIDEFISICDDKQTNTGSYFVRNTICTMPTEAGRITIINDRLIETIGDEKQEIPIPHDDALLKYLDSKFHIRIQ